jgi:hypothetical protein
MKNLAIYLAAGASALLVTAASAAPLAADLSIVPESNIQNVRMVCNEAGQCRRERGQRRVIIREHSDSYGYAPRRERYIERRGYGEGGGVGIRAPGVSVGIGTDRYWESRQQSEYEQSRGFIRGFFRMQTRIALGEWSAGIEPVLRHATRSSGRFSHVRGVCSPQPFRQPKSPDRNERENEKCSAGKEGRHWTDIHGILQEVERLQFFCSRLTERPLGLPRRLDWSDQSFISKICSDQIVRSPASTDVNLRSRRAYHITVAIERVQEAGLVGAGIRLNSPQSALVYEERGFQRAVVPPEPHGSPGLVIWTAVIWKLDHALPPIGLSADEP